MKNRRIVSLFIMIALLASSNSASAVSVNTLKKDLTGLNYAASASWEEYFNPEDEMFEASDIVICGHSC